MLSTFLQWKEDFPRLNQQPSGFPPVYTMIPYTIPASAGR